MSNNDVPRPITRVTYEDIICHMNAVDVLTQSRFGVTHAQLLQITEQIEQKRVHPQMVWESSRFVSGTCFDFVANKSSSEISRKSRKVNVSTTARTTVAAEFRTDAHDNVENERGTSRYGSSFQFNQDGAKDGCNLVCLPIETHGDNQKRRTCNVAGCPNRRVQGGVCIAHGAKRKPCEFPGCTKNRKVARKCSAHGPVRKRCEVESCIKAAAQGGKCIGHGGKKKLCSEEGCLKQSIAGGMCQRHYKENYGMRRKKDSKSDAI